MSTHGIFKPKRYNLHPPPPPKPTPLQVSMFQKCCNAQRQGICTCRFMGVYWANISSEGVCEAVESADAYIFVGPTFNDYSTCAFSHLLSQSKMVWVDQRRVTVAGKRASAASLFLALSENMLCLINVKLQVQVLPSP